MDITGGVKFLNVSGVSDPNHAHFGDISKYCANIAATFRVSFRDRISTLSTVSCGELLAALNLVSLSACLFGYTVLCLRITTPPLVVSNFRIARNKSAASSRGICSCTQWLQRLHTYLSIVVAFRGQAPARRDCRLQSLLSVGGRAKPSLNQCQSVVCSLFARRQWFAVGGIIFAHNVTWLFIRLELDSFDWS